MRLLSLKAVTAKLYLHFSSVDSEERLWVEYYFNVQHIHLNGYVNNNNKNTFYVYFLEWRILTYISQCQRCISSVRREGFNTRRT